MTRSTSEAQIPAPIVEEGMFTTKGEQMARARHQAYQDILSKPALLGRKRPVARPEYQWVNIDEAIRALLDQVYEDSIIKN